MISYCKEINQHGIDGNGYEKAGRHFSKNQYVNQYAGQIDLKGGLVWPFHGCWSNAPTATLLLSFGDKAFADQENFCW